MGDYTARPTTEQLRAELERLDRKRHGSVFGKVLLILLLLILITAALGVIFLPGFVIYGSSMSPSLDEGDIVISWPYSEIDNGDLVAFRYGERVLVKRVVGSAGDSLELKPDGSVRRNGFNLDEPYATFSADGEASDMDYPLTVPDGSYFVLGDNRGNSVDSRNSIIGFVTDDQMIGQISLQIWPLNKIRLFT